MPFRRRSNFRRNRKPYRRSRKGYTRGRFARKRFSKSVPRGLKAGLYIPRQAYVKLPFTQILNNDQELTSPFQLTFGVQGNGICCPLSQTLTGQPTSGDRYPLGLEQYSGFYKFYKVLGSSIKLQYTQPATAARTIIAVIIAGQGAPYDTDPSSNWQNLLVLLFKS